MARQFKGSRNTKETQIDISLDLEKYDYSISTGIGFFDHMLELFAHHGSFGLELKASGDTHIDFHHTVEDTGILLGQAFYNAAGDKKGIKRYGFFKVPMDEALVECVIDFGGRPYFSYGLEFTTQKCGDFDMELVEEFFRAFVNNAKINLYIIMHKGGNSHHVSEAAFKSFARALREALTVENDRLMSTKGIIE